MDRNAVKILGSLRHVIRSIDQQNKNICTKYKLTLAQLVCVRQLLINGPMVSKELARQAFITQATLTGLLDRLEAKGMVLRTRSSTDRRKVFISLSPEGEAVAKQMPWPLQERFAHKLERLDEETQQNLIACMELLVELIDAPEGETWPYGSSEPAQEHQHSKTEPGREDDAGKGVENIGGS